MAEAQANGARWFALERTLPAYHDQIAATGFVEELTNPCDEGYLLARWGGGSYRVTAKTVGKGRGGKKVLDTHDFDLSGPPRAYPGADGQPVLFPSAKLENAPETVEDDDDEEDEEDEEDDPRVRRFSRDRSERDRFNRDRFERDRFERDRFERDRFERDRFDPITRLREASTQRAASAVNTDAMKILNESNHAAQVMAQQQLQARDKEVQQLREALLSREDRANAPMQEAVSALKLRMEEQRKDFEAQMNALRIGYEQQITTLRSTHESQLASNRSTLEQQTLMLTQRHESELRILRDRQEAEIKNLQREIDRAREDANTRARDIQTHADRRVQEVRDLLAAQYETRISVLQSDLSNAQRRADEVRSSADSTVQNRIADERRAAEQRESLMREMLQGREHVTSETLKAERDRLREERDKLAAELAEARKAADPQTALRNVAQMAETMKSLGLAGPVGGKEEEEKVPDDMIGKIAAYAPKLMAAAEPVLRRADAARAATVQLHESRIRAQMHANQLAAQTLVARQGGQPLPAPSHTPEEAPAPVSKPTQSALQSSIQELLSALNGAYVGNMTPEQVAELVKSNVMGQSAESKNLLDSLLSRPGDEVASELSSAAEALGFEALTTPRGQVWLESVHRACNA